MSPNPSEKSLYGNEINRQLLLEITQRSYTKSALSLAERTALHHFLHNLDSTASSYLAREITAASPKLIRLFDAVYQVLLTILVDLSPTNVWSAASEWISLILLTRNEENEKIDSKEQVEIIKKKEKIGTSFYSKFNHPNETPFIGINPDAMIANLARRIADNELMKLAREISDELNAIDDIENG